MRTRKRRSMPVSYWPARRARVDVRCSARRREAARRRRAYDQRFCAPKTASCARGRRMTCTPPSTPSRTASASCGRRRRRQRRGTTRTTAPHRGGGGGADAGGERRRNDRRTVVGGSRRCASAPPDAAAEWNPEPTFFAFKNIAQEEVVVLRSDGGYGVIAGGHGLTFCFFWRREVIPLAFRNNIALGGASRIEFSLFSVFIVFIVIPRVRRLSRRLSQLKKPSRVPNSSPNGHRPPSTPTWTTAVFVVELAAAAWTHVTLCCRRARRRPRVRRRRPERKHAPTFCP